MPSRVCLTLAQDVPDWPAARRAHALLLGDERVSSALGWSRTISFATSTFLETSSAPHIGNCTCCVRLGTVMDTLYKETLQIFRSASSTVKELVYVASESGIKSLRIGLNAHLMLSARLLLHDYRA